MDGPIALSCRERRLNNMFTQQTDTARHQMPRLQPGYGDGCGNLAATFVWTSPLSALHARWRRWLCLLTTLRTTTFIYCLVRRGFLLFIHRNEHSRLVSIFGHGNRRLCDQNTQVITEVDVKLNKWHIAMEKLYKKTNWNEQFKKNMTKQWDRTTHLKFMRQ